MKPNILAFFLAGLSLVLQMGCADSPIACGTGTTLEGNACVAQTGITCGAGTQLSDGLCLPEYEEGFACGPHTSPDGSLCQAVIAEICGVDTMVNGESCIGKLRCGEGTTRESNSCVVDGSEFCGSGTQWSGSACVTEITDGSVFCGSGTSWSGGACIAQSLDNVADFSAFTANASNLTTSLFAELGRPIRFRFVATELSQATADAFTEVDSVMIGSGGALHMNWLHVGSPSDTYTIAIDDATDGNGNCIDLPPSAYSTALYHEAYVNFFRWSNTEYAVAVCSIGGSAVTSQVLRNGQYQVKIVFNVAFSDGSNWIDKVFYADYREN